MIHQIRTGIYPQLDHHRSPNLSGRYAVMDSARQELSKAIPKKPRLSYNQSERLQVFKKEQAFKEDPEATIQTGPGRPDWKWHSVSMNWNGPVDRAQVIGLWLLSPITNLILSIIRVFLLAFLITGLTIMCNVEKFPFSKSKYLGKLKELLQRLKIMV
ncbi:hypothetical protein GMMP1_1170041 [Candidatus Magnetomoraceae bacterium gMMP-1]